MLYDCPSVPHDAFTEANFILRDFLVPLTNIQNAYYAKCWGQGREDRSLNSSEKIQQRGLGPGAGSLTVSPIDFVAAVYI